MDTSLIATKAFLALALGCAIAVVIFCNIAGGGLLARLLVYAFLFGFLTSGIAAALSFRSDTPGNLQLVCRAIFGTYALTGAAAVIWVVVAKPAFG